jgi:hypothetical protein
VGVRVRVKIKYGGNLLETVALVNTGFETPNPQILLPVKAAEKLGIWPNLPRDASIEIYDTAGGPTRVYRVRNAVTVEVAGREGRSVVSDVVISHLEVEVLISDKLTEELMIAIEKPSEGIWRFRDEMVERKSERPEIWL